MEKVVYSDQNKIKPLMDILMKWNFFHTFSMTYDNLFLIHISNKINIYFY